MLSDSLECNFQLCYNAWDKYLVKLNGSPQRSTHLCTEFTAVLNRHCAGRPFRRHHSSSAAQGSSIHHNVCIQKPLLCDWWPVPSFWTTSYQLDMIVYLHFAFVTSFMVQMALAHHYNGHLLHLGARTMQELLTKSSIDINKNY